MPEFRSHRALQPPTGYAGTYSIPRAPIPSLTSLSDIARAPQYTTTPRGLECALDRTPNLMYTQPGPMYLDHSQRVPPPMIDAPPFYETTTLHSIVSGNQMVRPEIGAKIHKGFFQVDDKWTCYRRNYFSISCSFSFNNPSIPGPFYVKYNSQNERIHQFSMSISAVVNEQHSEIRELVQHTPKRDKQSERPPGRIILQPCPPTGMVTNLGSASAGAQHGFPLMSQSAGMPLEYGTSYGGAPQQSQPPTQHTFERIQFQKATANNGKRRAQQQYYNLVVDLYAEITGPIGNEWIKIARRTSHPMVVRGRSPGHYKDGRRDSSTSMGPDGGNGGAGDGGGVLPPGLGQASRSHLALMPFDSSQRGSHSYGRNDYHQMTAADHSPLSASPHISSSSSSTFDIGMMSDSLDPMDAIKSTSSIESYPDSSYGMMDIRKDNHYRHHPPPFDYDPILKSESSGTSFSEAYDPIASLVPHEPGDSSFLKHPPRMGSQGYHQPSQGSYDPLHSARSGNGNGSGPYHRLPSSQSLCT
ncbi:hypothetical protein BJY04DRAFT_70737 [Aspergillus karnatakaensis]|uniref:NDT80 / PhoG like DNA-binding family protein n=1 Tax=Aspergillus karnatakaensis TaxID=1810916 RepID=UPI003CCD73F0